MTGFMLAVMPLVIWVTIRFRRSVQQSYRRIRVAIAKINAYLQEHINGISVVQLFNREERSRQEFERVNRDHMEAFKDSITAYGWFYPVIEFLGMLSLALLLAYGGFRIRGGALTLGVLVAFFQYGLRFFRPIQDLSEKYNILQAAMAASERIFKLLDTPAEVVSPQLTKAPQGPGRIEFDHVWFAYRDIQEEKERIGGTGNGSAHPSKDAKGGATSPSQPDWVLRDVNFAIEPGETVAVVGHTGAGKTTMISLLLRFYDVQKGAVRIDGVDVKDMDVADLRGRFGVVLQDPFLFTGTIGGNIRLGTERIQDSHVSQAAEDVNLGDFIRSLPKGFDEEVRERGSTLSTGQKQLISFARALAHEPKILILDEATSSVDTETEFRVRDALARMVEGRTSLIIAHRLSTIQRADKIIVMHKGQLREMGTHQELLAHRGIYYKLYQLQYKDQEVAPSPLPTGAGQSTVSADD
jgi:ATP-binding cassette subfamily B protein